MENTYKYKDFEPKNFIMKRNFVSSSRPVVLGFHNLFTLGSTVFNIDQVYLFLLTELFNNY